AHSYVVGASALLVHNKPMMIRAETAAEALGFEKTGRSIQGQPVFKKGNVYIMRNDPMATSAAAADNPFVLGHSGGYWKMARGHPEDLVNSGGMRHRRMGVYDISLTK